MNIYRIFIVISFLFSILLNQISIVDLFLLFIDAYLSIRISLMYPFKLNLAKYTVQLVYWISFILMPSFRLVDHLIQLNATEISDIDYVRLLSFGSKVLFIVNAFWLFIGARKSNNIVRIKYEPFIMKDSLVTNIFIFMFALSIFSYSIGLSRMGGEEVALPFHMSGVINIIRISVFPFLFSVICENYLIRKKKIPSRFLILFFVWGLLEVFVRLSKSALVFSFIFAILVFLLYERNSYKKVLKLSFPLVFLFFFLYPIIEAMRDIDGKDLKQSFIMASSNVNSDESSRSLLKPLNRVFMIPSYFIKDYKYVDHDSFFDFSNTPALLAMGGAARYQTVEIDGFSLGAGQSSGTTGIQDPLLHGGYGLCYITVVLLFLFARFVDGFEKKKMYSIYVFLLYNTFFFVNNVNISYLYDGTGLPTIFLGVISIFIAYYFNFRKKLPLIVKTTR